MVLQTGSSVPGLRRGRGKGIRAVALVLTVMMTGFFCLSAWAPETDEEGGKAGDASGISSGASDEYTPGVLEQEAPAKVKKKHFPWFWVAAGAVVAGAVLYFTVIKKPEYKLNVIIGPGVGGYPNAGTFLYKKGKKVRYLFHLGYGYRDLQVTLDGKEVPVSGEVTMDRDHVLAAAAEEQFYDLTVSAGAGVSGTPVAGTYSCKQGTSVPYSYVAITRHEYLYVQVDGVDAAAQGSILMDRAHALAVVVKELDVRGTWRITTSNDYLLPTQKVIFAGSPVTGKVYRSNDNFVLGEYHVTGNGIRFWVIIEEGGAESESMSLWGTIRDMSNMGGNFRYIICDGCGSAGGTWVAVRVQ